MFIGFVHSMNTKERSRLPYAFCNENKCPKWVEDAAITHENQTKSTFYDYRHTIRHRGWCFRPNYIILEQKIVLFNENKYPKRVEDAATTHEDQTKSTFYDYRHTVTRDVHKVRWHPFFQLTLNLTIFRSFAPNVRTPYETKNFHFCLNFALRMPENCK